MRRKDREVTDINEKLLIIEKCHVCRVAFSSETAPYIIPMNFGFLYEKDRLILYFHCAKAGKKLDIMAKNPMAGFSMDCCHNLISGEEACEFTMRYESITGNGAASIVPDFEEKEKALGLIMSRYVRDKEFSFSKNAVDNVTIFKIEALEFTAKKNV